MSKIAEYTADEGREPISYPQDILKLQEAIPELKAVPMGIIQRMYRDFSDNFSAAWLFIDDGSVNDFKAWLNE